MKNENSILIGSRTIVWITIIILIFVSSLIGINNLDKSRKFKQFKSINEAINQSEYLIRIADLLENFSKDDSLTQERIIETLSQLENELDNISSAKLYLSHGSAFLEFSDNSDYYNFSYYPVRKENKLFLELNYLPKEIQSLKDYVDKHDSIDFNELFHLIEKDKKYIYSLVKAGKGYLYLVENRN